jgi:hypothetical protein
MPHVPGRGSGVSLGRSGSARGSARSRDSRGPDVLAVLAGEAASKCRLSVAHRKGSCLAGCVTHWFETKRPEPAPRRVGGSAGGLATSRNSVSFQAREHIAAPRGVKHRKGASRPGIDAFRLGNPFRERAPARRSSANLRLPAAGSDRGGHCIRHGSGTCRLAMRSCSRLAGFLTPRRRFHHLPAKWLAPPRLPPRHGRKKASEIE